MSFKTLTTNQLRSELLKIKKRGELEKKVEDRIRLKISKIIPKLQLSHLSLNEKKKLEKIIDKLIKELK